MTAPPITSDVSVVIACFNAASFLAAAIDSAVAQTVPPAEIIVVDDGSTDGSAEIAAGYGSKVILYRQSNAGPAAARNTAIRLSHGNWIAFLDGDDIWEPDKLARQFTALAADPAAVMCHTQMRLINGAGQPGSLGWGGTYRTYADLLLGCGVCTSSVLVRRDALFSAGLFDPLRRAAEDYDLWLRLTRFGNMIPIAEPLVRYRWHDDNASKHYLRTHLEITEIMTRHLRLASRENNLGNMTLARRGLRRTRQSTARQAFLALCGRDKGRGYYWRRAAFVDLDPAGPDSCRAAADDVSREQAWISARITRWQRP